MLINLLRAVSSSWILDKYKDSFSSLIDCPSSTPSASMAVKITDDSMNHSFKKGQYIFIELNSPLVNKEIGIFSVNGKIVVRKFFLKKGKYTLKAENKDYADISIKDTDEFYIIGKVL